jgi:hypothetical protein
MLRVDFQKPLTALEIRDPLVGVCREVADEFDLYAAFDQCQQPAFDGHSFQRNRKRIGNGKHKDWYIKLQPEHPSTSERLVTSAGKLAVKSHFDPKNKQFGGFDYGKYGEEPKPAYSFITISSTAELGFWRAVEPDENMLRMIYEGVTDCFKSGQERLFDIAEFCPEESARLTS